MLRDGACSELFREFFHHCGRCVGSNNSIRPIAERGSTFRRCFAWRVSSSSWPSPDVLESMGRGEMPELLAMGVRACAECADGCRN